MFSVFGQYAEVAKWAIYLAILTAVIALGSKIVNGLIAYGYNQHIIEIAQLVAKEDEVLRNKMIKLREARKDTPPPTTVTETIEKIKYVDKIVTKTVFKCDDIADYSGVRLKVRDCIIRNSGTKCLPSGDTDVQ